MDPVEHGELTARFVAWAERSERVVALVGVGSTSGLRAADRWSDHDLLIVTADAGEAAQLRQDPARLPLPDDPVLAFTEPDHGLTVLLADGHLLELAICGPDELAWFAADRHRVLVDSAGVASTLDAVLRRRVAAVRTGDGDTPALYRHLVKELVVVLGRLGRGERISAHRHLRAAVDDLLVLLQRSGRIGATGRSDPYDPARRLERTDPVLASRLDAALAAPLELSVARVLDLLGELVVPDLDAEARTLQVVLERLLAEALEAGAPSGG
jgi:hypothetical protein